MIACCIAWLCAMPCCIKSLYYWHIYSIGQIQFNIYKSRVSASWSLERADRVFTPVCTISNQQLGGIECFKYLGFLITLDDLSWTRHIELESIYYGETISWINLQAFLSATWPGPCLSCFPVQYPHKSKITTTLESVHDQ